MLRPRQLWAVRLAPVAIQRARRPKFAPAHYGARTPFALALAINLGAAVVYLVAVDALTDGVDYNFGLWAVPVACLLLATYGLGVMALFDRVWRRAGIGVLLAVPVAAIANLLWLLVYVLNATNGDCSTRSMAGSLRASARVAQDRRPTAQHRTMHKIVGPRICRVGSGQCHAVWVSERDLLVAERRHVAAYVMPIWNHSGAWSEISPATTCSRDQSASTLGVCAI